MRIHKSALFSLLLALLVVPALGAEPTPTAKPAQIVFTFEHPRLQPARYTFTIAENGTGHFVSVPGAASTMSPDDDVYPAPIDRDVQLDGRLSADLFRYARAHSLFGSTCERSQSGLAFTGNKTIAYTGPEGHGSCSFVWASDPVLQRLSDQLGSVAFTLEVGRRLSVEVAHDRLGLDAELESLQNAVNDQRAADLTNIAQALQTIAQDDQVMDRARKRAQALLSRAEIAKRN